MAWTTDISLAADAGIHCFIWGPLPLLSCGAGDVQKRIRRFPGGAGIQKENFD